MIPETVRPMPEPMRTLLLEGMRQVGNDPSGIIMVIEEALTPAEVSKLEKFLGWLKENKLTVGHGTISLRWDEFKSKRAPAGQEEAYQWAMKKMGV